MLAGGNTPKSVDGMGAPELSDHTAGETGWATRGLPGPWEVGWTILTVILGAQRDCCVEDLGVFCPPHTCTELIIIGGVLGLASIYVPAASPRGGTRNGGRGRERALVFGVQSALQAGSGTNPGSLSACGVISPQGIARHLDLTQPHLPTLRPFQGFKKINTILANPRLQLSAFAEVTVPLTYGEANWACSLLPIDST